MKKDLDLRPPAFKKKGLPGGTKTGRILCLLAVALIFLACWGGATLFQSQLEKEIMLLEREAAGLRTAAEPFLAVKEMREAVALRSSLEEKLGADRFSRTEILRSILATASPGPLIEEVKIGANGVIEIQGTASSIVSASDYSRKLLNLKTIGSIDLANIAFSENDGCSFTILALIDSCKKENEDYE
ncbi:MAG TPA: hypothetical protein ENN91_06235 [Firmicutes bacterium]|nr:hypothetical protein [Bacillota bacterium]